MNLKVFLMMAVVVVLTDQVTCASINFKEERQGGQRHKSSIYRGIEKLKKKIGDLISTKAGSSNVSTKKEEDEQYKNGLKHAHSKRQAGEDGKISDSDYSDEDSVRTWEQEANVVISLKVSITCALVELMGIGTCTTDDADTQEQPEPDVSAEIGQDEAGGETVDETEVDGERDGNNADEEAQEAEKDSEKVHEGERVKTLDRLWTKRGMKEA